MCTSSAPCKNSLKGYLKTCSLPFSRPIFQVAFSAHTSPICDIPAPLIGNLG